MFVMYQDVDYTGPVCVGVHLGVYGVEGTPTCTKRTAEPSDELWDQSPEIF